MGLQNVKSLSDRIRDNIARVIVGKDEVIELVLVSLFCSGHVLLEDVPGVGKTMLAKCLARSIDCDFRRIQFTPDLLPSELTGVNYFNQKLSEFVFRPGPLFANIILADEINRATPRTQSSLLECMEERQVTIDGETRLLKEPFFVIATQNPVEIQGTFPLPEAQLDRFFMRLKMGYPSAADSRNILDRFQSGSPFDDISVVAASHEVKEAQEEVLTVKVNDVLKDYIVTLVEETRVHHKVSIGVSPRGCLAVMKASQAYAAICGRSFVTPDDVKKIAVPVMAHRMLLKGYTFSSESLRPEDIVLEILDKVPTPVEEI